MTDTLRDTIGRGDVLRCTRNDNAPLNVGVLVAIDKVGATRHLGTIIDSPQNGRSIGGSFRLSVPIRKRDIIEDGPDHMVYLIADDWAVEWTRT